MSSIVKNKKVGFLDTRIKPQWELLDLKADSGGDALDYFKKYHNNLTKKYVRSNEDFEKLIIEGFIKSALLQVQRITAIMKDARRAFTDDNDDSDKKGW